MRFFFLAIYSWLVFASPYPKHIEIAQKYVGVKEATGHNDGPIIEMFQRFVGIPKGSAWCAAFVSYVLYEAQVAQPKIRSGASRRFILKNSIPAQDVLIGKVKIPNGTIVVWRRGNTIYGHVGFVKTQLERNKFATIEGNTSSGNAGSQDDGNGVYERIRKIAPANYFRITHFTLVTYAKN